MRQAAWLTLLALFMFLPGACGVASVYGHESAGAMGAIIAWAGTMLGVVGPPGAVVAALIVAVQRSCRTLDDLDLRFTWEGRKFHFTVDNPAVANSPETT